MQYPSLGDDLSQIPDYPDMIVIPFQIPPGLAAPSRPAAARTVRDGRVFSEIVAKLMAMKPEKVDNPRCRKGQWYRLPDGSEFGLRQSEKHGLTLDTPNPEGENIRVHQK